jgi:hypothetical protein
MPQDATGRQRQYRRIFSVRAQNPIGTPKELSSCKKQGPKVRFALPLPLGSGVEPNGLSECTEDRPEKTQCLPFYFNHMPSAQVGAPPKHP